MGVVRGLGTERDSQGRLHITFNLPAGDWIVGTLLGFGPGIEVLEPRSLREELAKAASAIHAINNS